MKQLALICVLAMPFLGSCDKIDAVGDKVNELKDARKESTQGIDGMDIKAINSGIQNAGPTVQDIGEVDFQTFISQPGRINVVDFHADWCGPCKKLGPVLTQVIEVNSGVARLGKLNVDSARELSQEQGVSSIPDVRFYIDGKLVDKFTGVAGKEAIQDIVAKHSATLSQQPGGQAGQDAPLTGEGGAPIPARPKAPGSKPLEEAMKPMDKDWLPPGMTPK